MLRVDSELANLLFLCMLDSYVICVSALHLEIVISHKIVGVPILRLVSI